MMTPTSAAANRRPAFQSSGSGNLAAIVAAARAFPAAVAELGRWPQRERLFFCQRLVLASGAGDSILRCEGVGTFEGGGLRFLGCEVTGRTLHLTRAILFFGVSWVVHELWPNQIR